MLWVSCDVVEVSTLVVGSTRHATRDGSRTVGHSVRQRRSAWRLVLGAHRRAVRVSSLQISDLLVSDDHPRRRQQTRRYHQRVARHIVNCSRSLLRWTERYMLSGVAIWFPGNHGNLVCTRDILWTRKTFHVICRLILLCLQQNYSLMLQMHCKVRLSSLQCCLSSFVCL